MSRVARAVVAAVTSLVVGSVVFDAGAQTAAPLPGARPPAPVPTRPISWTTERVAIFKDGYALVVKSTKVRVGERMRLTSDDVPDAAVLGCFWSTAEGATISGMTAQWVEETSFRDKDAVCLSVIELLRANRGRQVILGLGGGEPPVSGAIREILEEPAPASPASAGAAPGDAGAGVLLRQVLSVDGAPDAPRPVAGETVTRIQPVGGAFVVIETGQNSRRVAFPIAQIRSVTGDELATRAVRREEVVRRTKRLTIDLRPDGAAPAGSTTGDEATVRLFYFTPGVRWIPTYRVATASPESTEAEISLQAEVLNELEDVAGAKVDLVVGVPNFRFKGVISPMSLEPVLRSSLSHAAPQLMGQSGQFSNAIFTQRASEMTARHEPAGDVVVPVDFAGDAAMNGPGGGQNDDLFVYPLDGFELARGGRATIPLWTARAPLKHVYTMDLAIVRDKQNSSGEDYSYGRSSRFNSGNPIGGALPPSPLELSDGRIWHQLELRNNSNVPWTTGAALLLRGTLPLGQDLLTYTPVAGTTRLPVTVAINVQGSYAEVETAREPGGLNWNGYTYARVTKKATIKVSNYRSEASQSTVHLCIGGKVLKASEAGVVTINDYRRDDWGSNGHDYSPNNHSDVEWKFSLAAGKSVELVVEFEMFVR